MIYEEIIYNINFYSFVEIIIPPNLIPHKADTLVNSDYKSDGGW